MYKHEKYTKDCMKIKSVIALVHKQRKSVRLYRGFTIVELLVVIVVIGILAAVVIVAYTGVSQRAKAASITSDLNGAASQLAIYRVDNGGYPTTNDCSTGANPAPPKICLKSSGDNAFGTYTSNNAVNPQTFSLTEQNGTLSYIVTNDSPPVAYSPVLVSGGMATTSGGNTIRTFTSNDTLTVAGGTLTGISALVIGGGGGLVIAGGSGIAGGGGGDSGQAGGVGTAGFDGGSGGVCGSVPGGGGGAGGVGDVGGSCIGGSGGIGKSSSISGASICYAGGGSAEGLGNSCGGGNGANSGPPSAAGTPNTGGGGGESMSGGSGIVIISYPTP